VPPDQLSEAFIIRSSRLLDAGSIERLLISAKNPGDELLTLIDFEQSMVGDQNKQKLATFVRAIIGAHKTNRWFCSGGANVFERLSVCALAQKNVQTGGFSAEDKHELSTTLDRLCLEALKHTKSLEQIEARDTSPIQKAICLLKLPDQELITSGQCAQEAMRRAMRLLRANEVRKTMANDQDGVFQEISGLLQRVKSKAA
jgi:hypothetical protein